MFIFKSEFSLNGETDSVAAEYTVLNMNIYESSVSYIIEWFDSTLDIL